LSEVAVRRDGGDIIEAVITKGDLSKLTPVEKTAYYNEVCRSVGLNPFTRPFEFITLNGKLVLYARRECTDQLRMIHGVSVEIAATETVGDLYIVRARATNSAGKSDEDLGAVSIIGLKGEVLANAMMKATTKAKRRVTLSICGLGFLDESEVEGIPAHERAAPQGTRSQLDEFAAVPAPAPAAPEIVDHDTGEVLDAEDIHAAARAASLRGTEILRSHLRTLPPEAREMLRDAVGTGEEPGELLRAARLADAASIRERLRMATTEQITPAPPAPAVAGEAPPGLDPGVRPEPAGIPPAAAPPPPQARGAAAEPAGEHSDVGAVRE